MNCKKCYSNISFPFIVENLKRFWIGSLFALLAYIFICYVPIIVSGSKQYAVSNLLSGNYWPMAALVTLVPVFGAIFIYRYIQQSSSAAIVHSLPFSRKQLFNSSYLSGLVLCILPVVITAVLLIITSFTTPAYETTFDPAVGIVETNIFTIPAILKWTLVNSILTAAAFSMATFAAMLTGSTLIQTLLSLGVVFVVPIILEIIKALSKIFLYGYRSSETITEIEYYASPALAAIDAEWKYIICQAVIAVALYLLSYLLYRKRPMEKATDTVVFNFMKPILKYLITFIGMCCMALFLYGISDNLKMLMFFVGAVVGALIAYVGVEMLIQKSVKIKGFVKGFGIYAIAGALFFVMLSVDITGYERSIPDTDEIKGVVVSGLCEFYADYDEDGNSLMIKDKDVIDEVRACHQDLIDNKSLFFGDSAFNMYDAQPISDVNTLSSFPDWNGGSSSVWITYYLNNGKKVERIYTVPYNWIGSNEYATKIMESMAYKQSVFPILNWDFAEQKIISANIIGIYDSDVFSKPNINLSGEQVKLIFDAVKKDIEALSGNEVRLLPDERDFSVEFVYGSKSAMPAELREDYKAYYGSYPNDEYTYTSFVISESFTNTIGLLKSWGLYDRIYVSADEVDHVVVSKVNCADGVEQDVEAGVTITDKAQIAEILASGTHSAAGYSYNDFYYSIQLYPENMGASEDVYYAYRYYDNGKEPAFIKALF